MGGIKFAIGCSAGPVPGTTAKPRATAPVVLHSWLREAPELLQPRIHKRPETFDLINVNTFINDKLLRVWNDFLIVIDE